MRLAKIYAWEQAGEPESFTTDYGTTHKGSDIAAARVKRGEEYVAFRARQENATAKGEKTVSQLLTKQAKPQAPARKSRKKAKAVTSTPPAGPTREELAALITQFLTQA